MANRPDPCPTCGRSSRSSNTGLWIVLGCMGVMAWFALLALAGALLFALGRERRVRAERAVPLHELRQPDLPSKR